MHGHGAAQLVHRRCARASLSRQGLNALVEHARRGLRQDMDIAVLEMAAWAARLLRQCRAWISMHNKAMMGADVDDHEELGELRARAGGTCKEMHGLFIANSG